MKPQKEYNVKLNLLKALACIGVVFIHVRFPGAFGEIISYAATFAVPIFFMIAGYYAYGKDTATIKRRMSKIGCIFLFGYFLFFAYCALSQFLNQSFHTWLGENFNWFTPVKYTVFCTVDFAQPLWYLIAMVEVYIFWYFVVKHQKEQFVLKFMPLLFGLLFLTVFYCEAKQLPWFCQMNFLTQALPWFLLGYFLRTAGAERFRSTENRKALICIAIGFAVTLLPTVSRLVFPAAFHLPYSVATVGQVPYAFGLFVMALKNPTTSTCKVLEYLGRELSLFIYLFHTPIAGVLDFIGRRILGIDTNTLAWLWILPLLSLLCSILASLIFSSVLRLISTRKNTTAVS